MPNIDCGWLYVIDWFVYYVYAWSQLIHRYVYALIALTDSSMCICIDRINWFIDMYMHWSHWPIRILCVCIDCIDWFGYSVYALIALTDLYIMCMHWLHLLIRILCICIDHNWFIDMYVHWSHWLIQIFCICIDRIDRFV